MGQAPDLCRGQRKRVVGPRFGFAATPFADRVQRQHGRARRAAGGVPALHGARRHVERQGQRAGARVAEIVQQVGQGRGMGWEKVQHGAPILGPVSCCDRWKA